MKKRILAMLLSALLVMNISACNYESNDNVQANDNVQEETTTENSGTKDSSTNDAQNNNASNKITLSEYQELVGCYVKTESSNNIQQLMSKDESKIKVEHKDYGSNLFYITTFQDGAEYTTSIYLSEGIRTPDIYCGFTSEQNGYVMIFHMEGYAVSPMDDIKLACVLRTADGGKTWDKTEYSDFRVSNSREHILAACFFTENVGFFTARQTNTDHFGPRTYWTVNGGETWTSMPRLDIPNMLAPFGIGGDFSSEVSDVTVVAGVYFVTVKICHGYSCTVDGKHLIYIQYSSTDLENWTLIK